MAGDLDLAKSGTSWPRSTVLTSTAPIYSSSTFRKLPSRHRRPHDDPAIQRLLKDQISRVTVVKPRGLASRVFTLTRVHRDLDLVDSAYELQARKGQQERAGPNHVVRLEATHLIAGSWPRRTAGLGRCALRHAHDSWPGRSLGTRPRGSARLVRALRSRLRVRLTRESAAPPRPAACVPRAGPRKGDGARGG